MSIYITQTIHFHFINIRGIQYTQPFLTINFYFEIKYMKLAMKFHEIVMDTKIIKSKIF